MRCFENDFYFGYAIFDNQVDKEIKVSKENTHKTALKTTYIVTIGNESVELGVVRALQLIQALQYLIADLPVVMMPGITNVTEK